ncbi:hypothetical protein FH972_005558 [Carpinus fangiana]|uniref:Uncharacterized protein n=1 Tax=Carpinus fangiana TaxID=176857 RepID=A0A5N6QPZ2_9ROSI|nr:hypothetical protein FH972_005558 [Carpinus fangiana]
MSKLFVPPNSYNFWQDYMNVIPLVHLSHPVKLFARIIMQNVFPIDHHSNLWLARGRFIYALLTDVQIDFASIAIRLMKAMFIEISISLPYGSLISRQMRLQGTKDFEATTDHADTTEPGPSGGCSTSAPISLEDVMVKLNVMVTQMTEFSSILTILQKDVNELMTKVMRSSGEPHLANEDNDREQLMSD